MKNRYFALLFIIPTILLTACTSSELFRESFFAMDVYGEVSVFGKKSTAKKAVEILKDLDSELSNYNPDSELYKLNRGEITEVSSEDIPALTAKANALSAQYGGGVDVSAGALTELWGVATDSPYLPTREEALQAVSTIGYENIAVNGGKLSLPEGTKLDFGAVAKGYACDKIKEYFDREEVSYGIVSLDSSALLYGEKPDGMPFAVSIENPEGGEPIGTALVYETCLSSSGGYERYFEVGGKRFIHIFDLKTGFPTESGLTSVTVFCEDGTKSDFLSTLIFTEGIENIEKYLSEEDFQVVATDGEGNIYCSEGLIFTPNPDSGYALAE